MSPAALPILVLLAEAGLVTSTAFLLLVAAGAFRFRHRRLPALPADELPRVTLLKPLCGLEPQLEENIESFFTQDYPEYEIIFGVRDEHDPALKLVERARERHPTVPVRIVLSGKPEWPNAKVWSLHHMYASAAADFLVISDSDVRVSGRYLREVVAPLLEPKVGMVTCLYRGIPTGGIWSRLEALGMSVEMTSGVLVAEIMEGIRFALGPTMAVKREALAAAGGFPALAEYCADDYLLGNRVQAAGWQVVLSRHVIEHIVANRAFAPSMLHQLRWMKSTRFSRPKGHVGTLLTFSTVFGVLGCIAAVLADNSMTGFALLTWAVCNRMAMSVVAGWGVVRDRRALRDCWLYPVRDAMGFGFWCASFIGRTILWRDQRYRLEYGGKMIRLASSPGGTEASKTVAVDNLA